MAKIPADKSNRSDPKKNKSLAIRMVLKKLPDAPASEIAAAVKKEFGHQVARNMIYMVKTKGTMASNRRAQPDSLVADENPLTSAALWVEAIKIARQLLKATGSVENAVALIEAIDG